MLLTVMEGLCYCTGCHQLQLPMNGTCPWCATDHAGIDACRVTLTPQLIKVRQQVRDGASLPLNPASLEEPPRMSVAQRVEVARAKGICAPIQRYALYWDVPATVGLSDGVTYRHAYMDDDNGTIEVFKLETGIDGRLFVECAAFITWLRRNFDCASRRVTNVEPRLCEVDMRQYVGPAAASGFLSVDTRAMAACLQLHSTRLMPGCLPKLGFEFGALGVLPESYRATWRNFEGVPVHQNPAVPHTWWMRKQVELGHFDVPVDGAYITREEFRAVLNEEIRQKELRFDANLKAFTTQDT